jgi:hypothetical protein
MRTKTILTAAEKLTRKREAAARWYAKRREGKVGKVVKTAGKTAKVKMEKVVTAKLGKSRAKIAVVPTSEVIRTSVYTPSGKCPATLSSVEAAPEWADEVKKIYAAKNTTITDDGIRYFARQFYDYGSEEYDRVSRAIG